jgi:hypothetical protein
MKRRISVLYAMATLAFALCVLSACLATPIDTVDPALLGTWQGESSVRPPIRFEPAPEEEREPEIAVPLALTIHDDATVTGTVGDAQLVDCVLKRNRTDLGRQLNMASDYIVMDGYLNGPIIPGDEETRKEFTIPFNVVDGHMQGSVMWLKELKYPLPLLRVDLVNEASSS